MDLQIREILDRSCVGYREWFQLIAEKSVHRDYFFELIIFSDYPNENLTAQLFSSRVFGLDSCHGTQIDIVAPSTIVLLNLSST
jgi:hypothetical protein